MKRTISSFCTLALLGAASAWAQTPTLTLSPNRITNDYTGVITVTVANVTPGIKLWLAKYPDFNANGQVDSGEPLLQAWNVIDGVRSYLGEVRNFNVPGDEDGATNGQIVVALNFPADNAVLETIAGQYNIQVIDPQGSFAPLTAPFTIVQKAWPQQVSGIARDAGSGAPLTNAMVVMMNPNGNGGVGAFTDSAGHYAISNAPGSYALLAARPGWVANQGAALINLGSNASLTTNLTASAATLFIAGQVTDATNNKALPGIFIQAEDTNNLMSLAFTDTNGNYVLAAGPSQWKVKISSDSGLASKGYVQAGNGQHVILTSTSASNLNFSFPKATALIYGQVLDNSSGGISNLEILAQDTTGTLTGSTFSRAGGNYYVGVLGGTWMAEPSPESLTGLGLLGQPTSWVSLNGGQTTNVTLHVLRPTSHLIGRAVDNLGNPLAAVGLVVFLESPDPSQSQSLYTQTGPDGSFNIGVFAGQWDLALECNQAFQQGLLSPDLQFSVTDGVDQTNILLTAQRATATLTITVSDINGNPVLNPNAYASASVGTNFYNSGCGPQNGNTVLANAFNGTWTVGLSGDITSQGYDVPAQQTVTVNGANLTVHFVVYPLGQTPARLNASVQSGQLQLYVTGSDGHDYRIDSAPTLQGPWSPVTTNTAWGGFFWDFEPLNSGAPPHFYRTVRLQ